MNRYIILVSVLFSNLLFAKVNLHVENILKQNFSQEIVVKEKRLVLKKKTIKKIQKIAKARMKIRMVYLYDILQNNKVKGYGVVIKQRIRTKNATVLYMIDTNKDIKAVEILSFKEPVTYKPSIKWQKKLLDKNLDNSLKVGDDIPIITGATVSVKSITQSARIALALLKLYR